MKGALRSFTWTDKPTLPKEAALAVAVVLACCLAYFKLRSTDTQPDVRVAPTQIDSVAKRTEIHEGLKPLANTTHQAASRVGNAGAPLLGFGRQGDKRTRSVIERPLFDGLPVKASARLHTAIFSQMAGPVEAVITGFRLDSTNADIDTGRAQGGRLRGIASFNLEANRVAIAFTELLTREGRAYPVVGTAIDLKTQTPGIKADYSSGLPSRLLGVAIDRAITAVDQIAMAKLFDGTTDDSTASRELQKASIETNQQAAMNISAEATKDLRETGPTLSVAAGTPLLIEMRIAEQGEAP